MNVNLKIIISGIISAHVLINVNVYGLIIASIMLRIISIFLPNLSDNMPLGIDSTVATIPANEKTNPVSKIVAPRLRIYSGEMCRISSVLQENPAVDKKSKVRVLLRRIVLKFSCMIGHSEGIRTKHRYCWLKLPS